jgi:hypothetical protein
MKKIAMLAVSAMAVFGLSGCNLEGMTEGISQVYIDNLDRGYKISGTDTTIGKDVDLCFYGDDYVYGRGSEYFDGTFSISGGDIVFRDATDGGSYRLVTGGEIFEDDTYDFSGLPNNIHVTEISRSYSVNDCKGYGSVLRMASSLHLASSPKQ